MKLLLSPFTALTEAFKVCWFANCKFSWIYGKNRKPI